ncbi:MAG: HEAT repeat domain-containing protein [Planctomycetota bacterium]
MRRLLLYALIFTFICSSRCSSPSITSPNPDSRREAVDKMARSRTTDSNLILFTELLQKDPDAMVRAQCAQYLGKYQHKEAVPALIKATEDKDVFLRQEAVWALGEMKDTTAVPKLLDLLEHDSNAEIRRRSAQALEKIGDPKTVDELIQQLDDINQSVAYASLQALKTITKQDFGRDIKQWEKWKETKK